MSSQEQENIVQPVQDNAGEQSAENSENSSTKEPEILNPYANLNLIDTDKEIQKIKGLLNSGDDAAILALDSAIYNWNRNFLFSNLTFRKSFRNK
jgi:hypothetical protein